MLRARLQSNEVVTEDVALLAAEQTEQVVAFLGAPSHNMTGKSADLPEAAYGDETPDVGLGDFLSRPVHIATYTWNESDVIGTQTSVFPWTLFFSNPSIQAKLLSYAWLKCDLKVKVLINASPFYYGATLMSYQPLTAFNPTTISPDGAQRFFIPTSQRPHLWIYPQNNEGGEMTLPFFYPANWISTVNASEFGDMGTLTFTNVVPVVSANGATGTGVTVSLYAWAENVRIGGPTSGLLLQARKRRVPKDEYGDSPVGAIASAVATAAHSLSGVPFIGPFATATETGAQAIASVASVLGFSNPPVIEDTKPMRPSCFPVLASTEQSYPLEKLTIDAKNELSIDPRIVGLGPEDELTISHLVTRESYLTQFPWTNVGASDTLLFSMAVAPMMFDVTTAANPQLYLTPAAWVSQMFQYWRGDMIIRFKFVCTQYHRGRVRITYDPSGNATQNISNTTATQPVCFNEIVDLSKDTNVEVRVPYNQALAWCKTYLNPNFSTPCFVAGSTGAYLHAAGITNGMLTVRVVTALTAPIATAGITVLVSVRGADNLEFAAPVDPPSEFSYWQVQSDEYDLTEVQQVLAGNAVGAEIPERYLINHGEHVVSLRQLLRRWQYVVSRAFANTANTATSYEELFARLPPSYGYDPAGTVLNIPGLVVPGTLFKGNLCPQSFLSYITPAFIGYRGAVNWMMSAYTNTGVVGPLWHMEIGRYRGPQTFATFTLITTANTVSAGKMTASYAGVLPSGCGVAATHQLTNACVAASCPNYSRYKFSTTAIANSTASLGVDDTQYEMMRGLALVENASGSNYVAKFGYYASAGTDFNLHFFLNVPTIWVYSAVLDPN